MKTVSLADISFDQGLQLVMLRKQAVDAGQLQRMPEEAMQNTQLCQEVGRDFLKQSFDLTALKDYWKQLDPASKNVLLSGLAGAGVGAGAGAIQGLNSEDRRVGSRMFRGGLAGGALGAGAGLALNADSIAKKFTPKLESALGEVAGAAKPPASPSASGASSSTKNPGALLDVVDQLKSKGTSAPELQLGINAGLSAAPSAGALALLSRRNVYSPETLFNTVSDPNVNRNAIQNTFGLSSSQVNSNLASAGGKGKGVYNPDFWKKQIESAGANRTALEKFTGKAPATVAQHAEAIRSAPPSGSLLKFKPNTKANFTQRAKPLKNIFNFKRDPLGAVLSILSVAPALGGFYNSGRQYAQQASERTKAEEALNLINQSTKPKP
jgi:hypothetical protein